MHIIRLAGDKDVNHTNELIIKVQKDKTVMSVIHGMAEKETEHFQLTGP